MDSKTIPSWIDGIAQDLTDPSKILEDCLRKTLILAHRLKNDKLKTWVDCELNSYGDEESVPEYRKVGIEIWGNVAQAGYGGVWRGKKNIHFQSSNRPYFENLSSGFLLTSNVASLETIVQPKREGYGSYLTFSLSAHLYRPLEKLYPGWTLESAWIQISAFTITAVLSQIKTNLLQFLLALNDELGNEHNFSIMENPKKIDRILEQTIGHIHHADNVTIGTNYQTKGNQNTVVQGSNNTQQVGSSEALISEVKALSSQISNLLEEIIDIQTETKEDISHQLQAVNSQIGRTEPNFEIIGKSLQIIEGLLLNVAATVYTPAILATLEALVPRLNQV